MFVSDRTVGIGFFASGGYNHPKTMQQETFKHTDMIKLATVYINFWEEQLLKKKVDYAINLPSYGHIVAKKNNIFSKKIIIGKFKNTKHWCSNFHLQPDNVIKNFNKLKNKVVKKKK